MEGLTKLQQKRFILIGLGGLLAIFIAFFAQNINQIIWTGLSEGLQQISTVIGLDNLTSLGDVILWTMVTAMSWKIGLTVLGYILFIIVGFVIVGQYRKTLRQQRLKPQWYDVLFEWLIGLLSIVPLIIFIISFLLFGVYAFNVVQALNHLSSTPLEPILAAWNDLVSILNGFTFNADTLKKIIDLVPQLTSAFANVGDLATIWNQSVLFVQQLQVANTTLELVKYSGVILVVMLDVWIVYSFVQGYDEILPENPDVLVQDNVPDNLNVTDTEPKL